MRKSIYNLYGPCKQKKKKKKMVISKLRQTCINIIYI